MGALFFILHGGILSGYVEGANRSDALNAHPFVHDRKKMAVRSNEGDLAENPVKECPTVQTPPLGGHIKRKSAESYDSTLDLWCARGNSNPGPSD